MCICTLEMRSMKKANELIIKVRVLQCVTNVTNSYADENYMKYTTNILNWITDLLTQCQFYLYQCQWHWYRENWGGCYGCQQYLKLCCLNLICRKCLIQCFTNKSQKEATHVICKICVKAQNKYVSSWCVHYVSRDISLSKYGKNNSWLSLKSSSVISLSGPIYNNLSFN